MFFRPVEHDVKRLATTDDRDVFVRFSHDYDAIVGKERMKHIALEYLCEQSMQSCRQCEPCTRSATTRSREADHCPRLAGLR